MRLHLAVSVQDVVVRDLRARPEHRCGGGSCRHTGARSTHVQGRLPTPCICIHTTMPAPPFPARPSAPPRRSLVLIPHGGEDSCTLEAAFTTFVDARRAGPRLNILVQVRAMAPQQGRTALR